MKKFLATVIILLFVGAVVYFSYKLYLQLSVKLPVPAKPPAFSVSYLYYFPPTSPLEAVKQNEEVKMDLENIKNAGFDGIKLNFGFRRNNLASDLIAKAAAERGIYPTAS